MATFRLGLLGVGTPDASGNVFPQLAAAVMTNDQWNGQIWTFSNTGTAKIVLGLQFDVPQNYVGSATLVIKWFTTATSGNMCWFTDYRAIADGESLDPSSWQESVDTAAIAVPGTARLQKVSTLALTEANFAAGDTVLLHLSRDPDDGDDTVAAAVHLVDLLFQYEDA